MQIRPTELGLRQFHAAGSGPNRLGRCYGDAAALLAVALSQGGSDCILLITDTVTEAETLELSARFFLGNPDRVTLFPDPETLPYDSFSPHQELVSRRLDALRRIHAGEVDIVIVAVPTLLGRLPPVSWIAGQSLSLSTAQTISQGELLGSLLDAGYQRVPQVSMHGEVAVRGSLLDVYPMGCELPVRVDFFDTEIESLRTFDPDTQLTRERIPEFSTLPAREFPFGDEDIKRFRQRFRQRFEGNPANSDVYREVSDRHLPGGVENYLPLFFDATDTFWDYLPTGTLVLHADSLEDSLNAAWQQVEDRHEQYSLVDESPLLKPGELFVAPERHLELNAQYRRAALCPTESPDGSNLAVDPPPAIRHDPSAESATAAIAAHLQRASDRTLIFVESPGRRELILEGMKDADIAVETVNTWADFLESESATCVVIAPVGRGFRLPAIGCTLVAEQEILGRPQRRKRRRKVRDPDAILNDLNDLTISSPVVHEDYGVGRYRGLSMLDIDGMPTEFLSIEYAGGDLLHVPVSSLHLITRYTGGPVEHAPLHRLGTDQWARARRKAAERIRDVAAELLELYARREARAGVPTPLNAGEYHDFASGFPFELTEDQETVIDAVIEDLSSSKPMDRLVCGDVGFGKTEVALRAAFAAVNAGKQVAVLVPTTLLAQQHHQTFADRFADWPVRVESLSRFVSTAKAAEVVADLARGTVDIVIGTHRLLQKDIRFSELGLVIIDEEHRFGVRHKEKLKSLRTEVDILTLTATPIPRTLHMALGNLRELSLITTPPESRLSIKTFVIQWNAALIREACERELKRGGQVYFVHNRVEDIERIAREVRELLPTARVEVAHGQMRERDLEKVMLDFYHRRFHILVCTSIIESGLDVPNANTILINRADRFGLAQLHQLRGRVGRSHHKAFAYLIAPPRRSLTADARKRLEAIESLEDLGAGFVLATHDLEIRGAGELLGDVQSGQIQQIGFSLYAELLARTVDALRAGRGLDLDEPEHHKPEINLHVPALLPDDYMPDVHLRLVHYKRIASAPDTKTLNRLKVELIDRFGVLPTATRNLFRLSELRLECDPRGIRRIEANEHGITVEFGADTRVPPETLVNLVTRHSELYRLDKQMRLRFSHDLEDVEERFVAVEELLIKLDCTPESPNSTTTGAGHNGI